MADDDFPLLRIWKLYNETARELIKNPLSAGIKALQAAVELNNPSLIGQATEILAFIAEDIKAKK